MITNKERESCCLCGSLVEKVVNKKPSDLPYKSLDKERAEKLEAYLSIASDALEQIACWADGKSVAGDSGAAKVAREAIVKMGETGIALMVPKDWRNGQAMFNFLAWLFMTGRTPNDQSHRMGDPFNLSDDQWNIYWQEFLKEVKE